MAIVLPETYAHAPSKKYIIHYLKKRCNIKAVIDLPHNTFRPHCNAKTLLWIIEKGASQGDIIFAVAQQIGRDHRGKIKYRMRNNQITNEIWDDTKYIREEFDNPSDSSNEYTITVENSVIEKNVYVPRFYWYWDRYKQQIIRDAEIEGLSLVKLKTLVNDGIIEWYRGHGSPPNEYKGLGNIPYVRAGDIGNWAIYKNPTAMIPKHVYWSVKGSNGVDLQSGDIVFVKEGSYRIGDVAIVLPTDTEILLNSHCLVFRVVDDNNPFGIDSLYLMYLLTHRLTKRQIEFNVFYDTTLPNIGNRWLNLELPVSFCDEHKNDIKQNMKSIFEKRAQCEEMISELTSN